MKPTKIDIADFKLVHWLAKQTLPHVRTKKDQKLARGAVRRFGKILKTMASWGTKKAKGEELNV